MNEKNSTLPDLIKKDISRYLEKSEQIKKYISAGRAASRNSVWLILTNSSVYFHSCEVGKEPVIAVFALRKIKEIEYLQRTNEVSLTFIPFRDPENSARVVFPNEQREQLESFCEDLADLISFKKETPAGIRTIITPKARAVDSSLDADEDSGPILLHAASGVPRPELKAEKPKEAPSAAPAVSAKTPDKPAVKQEQMPTAKQPEKTPAQYVQRPVEKTVQKPEYKLPDKQNAAYAREPVSKQPEAAPQAKKPAATPITAKQAAAPVSKPEPSPNTRKPAAPAAKASAENKAESAETPVRKERLVFRGIRVGYILTSTMISVIVGFLWYKFFRSISTGRV